MNALGNYFAGFGAFVLSLVTGVRTIAIMTHWPKDNDIRTRTTTKAKSNSAKDKGIQAT